MPELPEVEVTRLGVTPYLENKKITDVVMRREGLRWPFPVGFHELVVNQRILSTSRRAKYLLIHLENGTILIHLGMSGHLRILPTSTPPEKHDHVDLIVGSNTLRFHDPRRFGAMLWHDHADGKLEDHRLLKNLGVEPLEKQFNADLFFLKAKQKKAAIKQVLLSGEIVVGVGNIYASESLFKAKINPITPANQISLKRYRALVDAIKEILAQAILQGGSSLKDFVGVDGKTGYFQQSYFVYGRVGQECKKCKSLIKQIIQGQRSSFYCSQCQK